MPPHPPPLPLRRQGIAIRQSSSCTLRRRVKKMPGTRSSCLLEALVYDGAPKGRRRKKRDAAAASRALREELGVRAQE
eukprot:6939392-Prymnesium_polylepis.1